jgi:hypothetical protein
LPETVGQKNSEKQSIKNVPAVFPGALGHGVL